MPGIAGIVGKHKKSGVILRMTEQMRHEDFYSIDTYEDENIALGITSLIPENRITFNETKTLVAVIGGEIFGLPNKDNETILRLYEKEGTNFLSRINGWFNIVIYDFETSPHIFLITDKYGFEPLFYTDVDGGFIFASEIKAILAYPDFNKEVDPVGVAEFALFNYPLGDRTLVKNIRRVPPASIWEFRINSAPTKRKYWEMGELISKEIMSTDEALRQCGRKFKEVVNSLIKGENEIGLTLTGGYDTRAILSALGNVDIKCLTFGPATDTQAIIASKLAQLTHCEHQVKEFGSDFVVRINEFLSRTVWITDGLCNIAHCGLLYVFSMLKQSRNPSTYLLGYGGSELIRGLQNVSLALSENAKNIIMSNNPAATWHSIINEKDAYGVFSYEFLKNFCFTFHLSPFTSPLSPNERALFFTIAEVFRKYYWSNIALIGSQVRVRLPYLTHEFVEFVLRTPFSILHTHQFSHNPFERLKGQKFSASIIKYNRHELLGVPTDRGYKIYCNLHWFGYPIIFGHQIWSRIFVGPSRELPLIRNNYKTRSTGLTENIKKIIDEILMAGRDYYNMDKLHQAIENYPNWNEPQLEELSKIVTFELWLRQFID